MYGTKQVFNIAMAKTCIVPNFIKLTFEWTKICMTHIVGSIFPLARNWNFGTEFIKSVSVFYRYTIFIKMAAL